MEDLNLDFDVIVAGSKNIQSTPIVSVKPTKNHFVLNAVALDMMGLEKGDYVTMLYVKGDNEDRRYFITRSSEEEKGAKLGAAGSSFGFNYSGIFGSAYLNDATRKHVSIDELQDKGLFIERPTEAGGISVRGIMNINYNLESIGEKNINNEVREVFAFVNRKEVLVNPNDEVAEEAIEGTEEV